VDYLSNYQGLTVFMEDLNGIRDENGNNRNGKTNGRKRGRKIGGRMNKHLHPRPFHKLQQFLKYKLE